MKTRREERRREQRRKRKDSNVAFKKPHNSKKSTSQNQSRESANTNSRFRPRDGNKLSNALSPEKTSRSGGPTTRADVWRLVLQYPFLPFPATVKSVELCWWKGKRGALNSPSLAR